MIRISNIKIRKDLSENELLEFVLNKYKISKDDILDWSISKKSIDARKKEDVHYVFSLDFKLKNENKYKSFDKVTEYKMPIINIRNKENKKVVIVGSGPSGLFASLILVQNGISPVIVEQGDCVEKRKQIVWGIPKRKSDTQRQT